MADPREALPGVLPGAGMLPGAPGGGVAPGAEVAAGAPADDALSEIGSRGASADCVSVGDMLPGVDAAPGVPLPPEARFDGAVLFPDPDVLLPGVAEAPELL